MQALIGIDIGTSAVKGVLCALSGARLAGYAAPYPTARPAPRRVEQDAADWWAHVMAALDHFAGVAARDGVQVAGIGVTSQVNTHLFCGPSLTPLAPAIVWQDGRAAEHGAALEARITAEEKTRALGAPIPIDASHALSRMRWMAGTAPDIWAETAHVLLPKDWVIARLTGRVSGDPISAVGLVGPDHRYAAPVLALVARAAQVLPPLADPLDIAGRVLAGPFAGVPVVTGTMDAWASMFGTGVASEGQAMNLSGTSEVLGLISARRRPEPGVITFPEWRAITLHAGPTQAGGASLGWLARLFGTDVADLPEPAPVIADSPLFLPHLEGERAPLWDMTARGAFAGLSGATGPAEMVAAVMEGVAFSARLALEALERSGDRRVSAVQAGGGGTASDAWCAIRADALGRSVIRMEARDAGAMGAMVMAGVGTGLLPDLATAAKSLVREDRRFTPDPEGARLADTRFALWRALYAGVGPVNTGLAAGRG